MLFTPDLDKPAVTAALRRLGWDLDTLAARTGYGRVYLEKLLDGTTYSARGTRRVQVVLNQALGEGPPGT